MVYKDIEQGTHEWLMLRLKMVTGTSLDDVMGTDYARISLICRMIAEELTEQAKAFKSTATMERGTGEEIFAIKRYETKYNTTVDRVAFCVSDEFSFLGCSPDGLIADPFGVYIGGAEVKSPDTETSVFYQLSNQVDLGLAKSYTPFCGIPYKYKWQVLNYFIVCDTIEWVDFIVYDERIIDEDYKLYVKRINRNDPVVQMAITEAKIALAKFALEYQQYRKLFIKTDF